MRQHSRLVANSILEVSNGFIGDAITDSSSIGRAVFEKCVNKTLTAITFFRGAYVLAVRVRPIRFTTHTAITMDKTDNFETNKCVVFIQP